MGHKYKMLLPKAVLTKTVCGAAAAAALTTGAVLGTSAYQSGMNFHPSGTEREFNANQVNFSDDKDVKGRDSTEENKEDFLQKDKDADDANDPKKQEGGNYLLENEQQMQQDGNSMSVIENVLSSSPLHPGGTALIGGVSGDQSYGLTTDRDNADMIIGGNPGGTLVVPGTGTGTGENGGQGGTGTEPGDNGGNPAPSQPDTPAQPTNPAKPDTSPGGGDNGGGTPNVPDTPSDFTPTDRPDGSGLNTDPTPGMADSSSDAPDGGKTDQAGWFQKETISGSGSSITKDQADNGVLFIQKPDEISIGALYRGQKNVSAVTIFNSLETYVVNLDDFTAWQWNNAAMHLGSKKFFMIDAVRFYNSDGELLGEYKFTNQEENIKEDTIDIPADAVDAKIDVSYRYSTSGDWQQKTDVDYYLEQTRLFVMKHILSKENEVITNDMTVNGALDQTPVIGSTIYLYKYQNELLKKNKLYDDSNHRIFALFPGWMENGELVDWSYTVAEGRHVLEPAAVKPLDSRFTVKMVVSDVDGFDSAMWFQTLTAYTGQTARTGLDTLEVPKYVQVVRMDDENTLSAVNTLKLPDTVLQVDTSNSNLRVNTGYVVDAENPMYSTKTDENGCSILTNKDGTAYLGIPYSVNDLVIPADVDKVVLPEDTNIGSVVLQERTDGTLPDIDFGGMTAGVVVVPSDLMNDFVDQHRDLSGTGIEIIASDSDAVVKNDAIFSNNGQTLNRVFVRDGYYTIPGDVTKIEANAFADAPNLKKLVLSKESRIVPEFDAGSFADSGVTTIVCSTQTQAESLDAWLAESQLSEKVHTVVLRQTAVGETYFVDAATGEAVLMNGSPETRIFDGKIDTGNGKISVTGIADGAFEKCTALQWALLPETVNDIGARAFYGCTGLEGVLIDTTGEVTIGNLAFDKCTSMSFIASNAIDCELNGYSINTGASATTLYAPTNAQYGYDESWTAFDELSGVAGFALVNIGSTEMLYGTDTEDEPWLGLRSGRCTEGALTLPTTTIELFDQAFYGTTGTYTLNWEELTELGYIDNEVFTNTGLTGKVDAMLCCIGNDAFMGTDITEVVLHKAVKRLDGGCFSDCRSLAKFTMMTGFAAYDYTGAASMLFANLFGGCSALEDVTITDYHVPQLAVYGANSPFTFNYDWTWDDTVAKVHIIAAEPDRVAPYYIRDWRYAMLGSLSDGSTTGYETLWNNTQMEVLNDMIGGYELPDGVGIDEETDARTKQKLIDVENNIRRLLGAGEADEPTDYYPLRVNNMGDTTVTGAPSGLESAVLQRAMLDFPWWRSFNIGADMFRTSPNLSQVDFRDGISGIEQNAFRGVRSNKLTLDFYNETPPALLNPTRGEGFSFGVDEDKLTIEILVIDSDWNFIKDAYLDYIERWVYPMAGYADYDDMYAAIAAELGEDAAREDIHAKMTELLLPVENHLRSMMVVYEDIFAPFTPEPVKELSFQLGRDAAMLEPDNQNPPEEDGELTPIPSPDTDSGSSGGSIIEDGSANEPSDRVDEKDGTDATPSTDPANEPVILPMEDGVHEIVIPAEPPVDAGEDTASAEESTEEKGETE